MKKILRAVLVFFLLAGLTACMQTLDPGDISDISETGDRSDLSSSVGNDSESMPEGSDVPGAGSNLSHADSDESHPSSQYPPHFSSSVAHSSSADFDAPSSGSGSSTPSDSGTSNVEEKVLSEFRIGSFVYELSTISGYWRFDRHENSVVKDLSGNGNDILLGDLSLQENSVSGRALRMTESGNATIQNAGNLWGSDTYTINFWLRFAKPPANDAALITKASSSPHEIRLWLTNAGASYVLSSEKISWYGSNSVQKIWSSLNRDVLMDEWAMLTLTYDGRNLRSFVNGKLDIIRPMDAGKAAKTPSPAMIGAEKRFQYPGVEGWMDELFFARTAMSVSEVEALYQAYGELSRVEDAMAVPFGIDTISSVLRTEITSGSPFFNPGYEFRQIQYGMGRTPQMDLMKRLGFGGTVIAAPNKNYLNELCDWPKLRNDLSLLKAAGFSVWIYDEDLFPSGAAGGLTVKDHPEFETRGIYEIRQEGSGTGRKILPLPTGTLRFAAAVIYPVINQKPDYKNGSIIETADGDLSFDGMMGNWVLCAYVERTLSENHATQERKNYWQAGALYPNLLDLNAVKRYIELTHQQYKDQFGTLFGHISAFYTGEPSIITVNTLTTTASTKGQKILPWEATLPDRFYAMHGYRLESVLGEIYDTPATTALLSRMHFFQTVGTQLSENFFEPYRHWCEENGGALSGHLLLEGSMSAHVPLYGDFLQSSSSFQIAGYDHLVFAHGSDYSENIQDVKYAYSPVRHKGIYLAQSLYEPIVSGYYSGKNDGFDIHPPLSVYRSNTNRMAANGANIFTNYATYNAYPIDEYRQYMDYQARITALMRGARDDTKVAVYYNIETYQARYAPNSNVHVGTREHDLPFDSLNREQKELFSNLFQANINFNILGRYDFDRISVANGKLIIGDYAYEAIVMPSMDLIPLSVLRKLDQFRKGGGLLIWTGKIPSQGAYQSEQGEVSGITSGYSSSGGVDGVMSTLYRYGMGSSGIDVYSREYQRSVYYTTFTGDVNRNGKRDQAFFIVNNTYASNTLMIGHRSAKNAIIYDPREGRAASVSFPFYITVGDYSAIVVVVE
jgi:hypothetical protein